MLSNWMCRVAVIFGSPAVTEDMRKQRKEPGNKDIPGFIEDEIEEISGFIV